MSIYYAPKSSMTRLGFIVVCAALLTACASPSQQVSIIPTETADITRKDGVFTQPLAEKKVKPGCKGECPTLQVDSLVFPGNKPLTDYVDQQLAQMAHINGNQAGYASVDSFTKAYWNQAGARDEAIFYAKPRYRNKDLTVVELGFFHYSTGAAHGSSQIQLVNWNNKQKTPLFFADIIKPGQTQAFNDRLQQAHQQWLQKQDLGEESPAQYKRVWPFQPSENIALTDAGVLVKYNSYEIAPYSSGQPELLIPYPQLQNILQPMFLPEKL